jgi:hypothetical protein
MTRILRRSLYYFVPILLLLPLLGCNQNQVGISGQVSLDNQPVHEGTILFIPMEGTPGSAVTAKISDGRYSIQATPSFLAGKFKVQIHALKKTGAVMTMPDAPGLKGGQSEVMEEAIPEHYNKKSTLERELKAGTNELNFELSTKK